MKQLSWSEQKLNALSVRRVVGLYFRIYLTDFFTNSINIFVNTKRLNTTKRSGSYSSSKRRMSAFERLKRKKRKGCAPSKPHALR